MPKIAVQHPDLDLQKTYLTAQTDADDTYSTVENNDGFATNDLTVFGHPGEERSEIVTLTGTTDNDIIDHATGPVFGHSARTPVYQILYNQAEIHRATAEGGSYSLITTVDLDIDQQETVYNDTAGDQNSWYKVRYKNSVTTTYSDYTDEVQGSGFTDASLSTLTDTVLAEFGDPNSDELTRDQVRRFLNQGTRKVVYGLIKTFPSFRTAYTTQSLTADTATYSLPTRFLAFKRVDVNFTGSSATDAYKAKFDSEEIGFPDTEWQQTDPRIFIRGTNFGIRPTPSSSAGTAFIWYWDYPAALDNESDEHGLPYGAEECLVFYALFRAWLSKNQEKADRYKGSFESSLEEYLEFIGQQRQMMWKPKVRLMSGYDLYDSEY